MSIEKGLSAASRWKDFGLNPFEGRLIGLMVAGYTSEESTRRLGISEPALQQHLMDILDKLKVADRLELVLFALHHQLIVPASDLPSESTKRPSLAGGSAPQ